MGRLPLRSRMSRTALVQKPLNLLAVFFSQCAVYIRDVDYTSASSLWLLFLCRILLTANSSIWQVYGTGRA
jgi:hypothetical protein